MTMTTQHAHILIREDRLDDVVALLRLAALDGARVPAGPLLVAEVDGELWAALGLADGAAVADPFHPTADLVALLRLRAEAVRAPRVGRLERVRQRLLLWERLWARARPGELV